MPAARRTTPTLFTLLLCGLLFAPPAVGQFVEVAKLVPSDAVAGGSFGEWVDVSGEGALVGPGGYVYEKDAGGPGNWGEVAILLPGVRPAPVALDGDTAAVGAPDEDSLGTDTGAVHVFQRDASGWFETVALVAPGQFLHQMGFGRSATLDHGALIAGAYSDSPIPEWGGRAYAFQRNLGGPDNWGAAGLLYDKPSFRDSDGYGVAVAIDGETAAVGMTKRLGFFGPGAVAVFQRVAGGGNHWALVAAIDGTLIGDLGRSVAIDGDRIAVGAPLSRAAHVFERDAGGADTWGEVAVLTVEGAALNFGWSVAVAGDLVLVGSPRQDGGRGSVHVFDAAAGWAEVQTLTASDAAPDASFGSALAVDGERLLVGACKAETTAEGAAPRPHAPEGVANPNCQGGGSGAAYLFEPAE